MAGTTRYDFVVSDHVFDVNSDIVVIKVAKGYPQQSFI